MSTEQRLPGDEPEGGPNTGFAEDRAHRLMESNHRVANSLQLASGFLSLQAKQLSDPAGRRALGAAAARISAIADLHRYLTAHVDSSVVRMDEFLAVLCPKIAKSTGLAVSLSAQPMEASIQTAQQIAFVVTELALNAGKHGYPEGEVGRVSIDCRRDGDGNLQLDFTDDGRGLPEQFEPKNGQGFGMTIVRSILERLHGELRVKSGGGAGFQVTVPLP